MERMDFFVSIIEPLPAAAAGVLNDNFAEFLLENFNSTVRIDFVQRLDGSPSLIGQTSSFWSHISETD